MATEEKLNIIAKIKSDFPSKFGIPRQSGLVPALRSTIIFEPEYRNIDAVRGLEQFSHIWLIWGFSDISHDGWSPTVRPPRLGGNTRLGVFATRSPFRPNSIGLSCVKLEEIELVRGLGAVLHISGADLMDGTPIYDIKPYLPYVDSKPDACGGFTEETSHHKLTVNILPEISGKLPSDKKEALIGVLAEDPRPAYQSDPDRIYGFNFSGFEVKFQVDGDILTVTGIEKA